MSTETKPQVVVREITINGKPLKFAQRELSGRSKEKKGWPVLVPTFSADGANFIPSIQDLGAVLAALGQDALLKAVSQQILIPLGKEASEAAAKKGEDGKVSIDSGHFTRALLKAVADFTSTAAKLDELKTKEKELNDALAKVTGDVFALIGAKQPVPQELSNKASQLLLERDALLKQMAKKSTRGEKKADAAAPKA